MNVGRQLQTTSATMRALAARADEAATRAGDGRDAASDAHAGVGMLGAALPVAPLARLRSIVDLPAPAITTDQWKQLAGARAAGVDLGLPSTLPDAAPLDSVLARLGRGEPELVDTVDAQRYLDVPRLARMSDEQVMAEVDALTEHGPQGLDETDWIRLSALLDSGRETGFVPQLARRRPVSDAVLEIAVGQGTASKVAARERDFLARAIRKLDPAAQQELVRPALARPAAELETADWDVLSAAQAAGVDLGLPATIPGEGPALDVVLARLGSGTNHPGDQELAQLFFETARVASTPAAELRREVEGYVRRGVHDLAPVEWARLSAMVDLGVDTGIASEVPGVRKFDDLTRAMASGAFEPEPVVQRYFNEWLVQHDPSFGARLDETITAAVQGRAAPKDAALIADQSYRFADLLEGRPVAEQAIITRVLLGDGSRNLRDALVALREIVPPASELPASLAPMREHTLALVERNVDRMAGRTPSGAVYGYGLHPDYGEIGQVRSNVELMQHARAMPVHGAAADTVQW